MGPGRRWARAGRALAIGGVIGCGAVDRARHPSALAPASAARPWTPPADAPTLPALPAVAVVPEAGRVYDLPALIDLAQRTNPATRRAWEQARTAAARLGLAESAWLPVLAVRAAGGTARLEDRAESGPVYTTGPSATLLLTLEWTLLDFGRRAADTDRASSELLAAGLGFNRTHQEVVFAVQRAFYAFDASRGRVEAAHATLDAARAVERAAQARLDQGLATQTEFLLARQERARAQYELQTAQRGVADTQAALAAALGVSPAAVPPTTTLADQPLPLHLSESVEAAMDRGLAQRPDLAARLATLRAREAEVRRARAEFFPRFGVTGAAGGTAGRFSPDGEDIRFGYAEPLYTALLQLSWTLFDGFARENAVRAAEARRGEAAAEVEQLQVETLRQIWTAYADVKVALLQLDFANALLAASRDASDSAFTSYTAGLADVLDLLAAERELARARMTVVDSRAQVLNSAAALAFAIGEAPGPG